MTPWKHTKSWMIASGRWCSTTQLSRLSATDTVGSRAPCGSRTMTAFMSATCRTIACCDGVRRAECWFSDPDYGINTDYQGGKAEPELPPVLYRLDPVSGALDVAADDFGPSQCELNGLDAVEVEVVPMLPRVECPHLELLCYRNPRGRPPPVLLANDIASTRIVWESNIDTLLHDPDGHLHLLRRGA